MFTETDPISGETLEILQLEAPASWCAFVIKAAFPATSALRPQLYLSVQRLVKTLRAESRSRSVFLLFDDLHKDNAIRNIGIHGRAWGPEIGLGTVPHGPVPRYWTTEDFLDRDYNDPIPSLMHTVAYLDASEQASEHACEIMTGSGGLIQVLHAKDSASLKRRWRDTFQPLISEPGLAAYPVYLPLLGPASLQATSDELSTWMGEAEVYLREDTASGGTFVLSRSNVSSALRHAGFRFFKT